MADPINGFVDKSKSLMMLMLMMKLPELLKMERHKSKLVSQLCTFSSPAFFLSFFFFVFFLQSSRFKLGYSKVSSPFLMVKSFSQSLRNCVLRATFPWGNHRRVLCVGSCALYCRLSCCILWRFFKSLDSRQV
jgi:hypothetical protein